MPEQIKVISTKEACRILAEYGLKTDPQTLGLGLQQRVYPFGVAIEAGRWIYEIYLNLLLKWIKERTMTMEENQNDQKENQNTENR